MKMKSLEIHLVILGNFDFNNGFPNAIIPNCTINLRKNHEERGKGLS